MGDAAAASKQLVKLAQQPSVLLPLKKGWDEGKIIPAKGSKNIPLLRWANDVVMYDRTGNVNGLNRCFKALSGYFEHAKKYGQFHGEEYSTIYWRWIVLPVWIGWLIATKRGHNVASDAAKWLADYVTHCILGTFYTQGDWYYGGCRTDNDIYVSQRKWWSKRLPGVPTSTLGFSRSWVFNKGNDNTRDLTDGMSWVDGANHAVWLSWVLGFHASPQWVGAQGTASDFVGPIVKGFSKQYPNSGFVSSIAALKDMYTSGTLNRDLVENLQYGPTFPIVYGRNTGGSFAVGTKSFNDGSTCFMHARTYMSDRYYRVYGAANPFKRSNSTPSTAESTNNWQSFTMYARDGKVWDWWKMKMVAGTKEIPLPTGEWSWLISVGPGGKSTIFEPSKPPTNGGGSTSDPWYIKLYKLILSWF